MSKWKQFFKNPLSLITDHLVPKKAETMVNTAANSAAGVSTSIDHAVEELQAWRSMIQSVINFLDDYALNALAVLFTVCIAYTLYRYVYPKQNTEIRLDDKTIDRIAELAAQKIKHSNQSTTPTLFNRRDKAIVQDNRDILTEAVNEITKTEPKRCCYL